MWRSATRILSVCGFLMAAVGAYGQAQEESPYLKPTASLYGNSGLWKVLSADTVPRGQAGFSVWYDRITRNPGHLTISTVGFGGSVGLTDWLEFGANFEVNRRVLVRRANQLSFGQQELGFFGNQTPGSPPRANELMPGSTILPQLRFPATPTGTLTGAAGYYNLSPFASVIQGNGIGTVGLGFKFNVLSEAKGDPLGLGARIYANIPTHRSTSYLLRHPTQTGGWHVGTDILVSKNVGNTAGLYWNAGFRGVQSPDAGRIVVLSDVVPLSMGITIPRDTRIQFVHEVNAELFVGNRTPNTTFGAEDAVDVTLGLRAFINRYLNLSAGYRLPLSHFGGDNNGFVVQLGYRYGPPAVVPLPSPPSLTCTADPAQVLVGEMVRLSAQGVSSTGAALTYEWSTTGGTIEGSGPVVQLRTDNLSPGTYTATVRATEVPGVFADCTTQVTVRQPPPPPPPTVSCSADRTRVQVGEVVTIRADARSPANRPLTYQWSSTGGRVEGTGTSVRFDTTNLQPGNYTVRVRVSDDINQTAECSVQITVEAPPPPPPPQTVKLDQCSFRLNNARVDNVCKAILDNVALRLQSEPDATLAIVGYAAANERNAQTLARTRAENTKTYLARDKGIAEARLDVRTGPAGQGAEARRVELHLVPRGATFTVDNVLPLIPAPEQDTRVALAIPAGGFFTAYRTAELSSSHAAEMAAIPARTVITSMH
ncbi:MAG: PKD domain-containing protein [Acidobacteria bacterium]|nr:PKD domain-containing protein [Acidobacteriota bacterium]